MAEHTVLAIDPGSEKCGIAIVHKEKGILEKNIIETTSLTDKVTSLIQAYNVARVVIGDGTTSQKAQAAIKRITVSGQQLVVVSVNEYRSTDEARIRYWRDNPPKGIKRFIPTTMQVPPVPVDDYVAIILAERYFKSKNSKCDT